MKLFYGPNFAISWNKRRDGTLSVLLTGRKAREQ